MSEIEWLRKNYVKLGPHESARRLEVTYRQVTKICSKHGILIAEKQREWPVSDWVFLLENYNRLGGPECARRLNVSMYALRSFLKRMNIKGTRSSRWDPRRVGKFKGDECST